MRSLLPMVLFTLAVTLPPGPLSAQADRRDRQFPELVPETGGRVGTCDALVFTPDGDELLAAGDDKVVRVWKVAGDKLKHDRVLRWPAWREQRGSIYALALSPDGKSLAVGGWGMRTGAVMVLDRETGKVTASLQSPGDDQVVRALAFSPDGQHVIIGTELGNVWRWKTKETKADLLSERKNEKTFNRVRMVAFLDDKTLASVCENRDSFKRDVSAAGQTRRFLDPGKFENLLVYQGALSPDKKWIALGTMGDRVYLAPVSDPSMVKIIKLPKGSWSRSIAFSGDETKLAVGIATPVDGKFLLEHDHRVVVYDITGQNPTPLVEFDTSYRAEALAFHPKKSDRLAVAGGADHEVTLWDVGGDKAVQLDKAEGAGKCLWSVELSEDKEGRFIRFQDEHEPAPPHPNARGKGAGRVFDLQDRKFVSEDGFKAVPKLATLGGWTVKAEPKTHVWKAIAPDKTEHKLPIDIEGGDIPMCWTFLDNPPRLVVGHYWGMSVFDLGPGGIQRKSLCVGHQGPVTSLAASADGSFLVSSSRDQTVAGWSLTDWKNGELGAAFALKDRKPVVTEVDQGSPAWEAGLTVGDEIEALVVMRGQGVKALIYSSVQFQVEDNKFEPGGDAAKVLTELKQPVPGNQLFFRLKKPSGVVDQVTTRLLRRPLWRFLPARGSEEFVLWMWRHPYYDTSTHGDSLLGWLVNDRDPDRKPSFYPLERFRDHFQKTRVIDILIQRRSVAASLVDRRLPLFHEIEPRSVDIAADTEVVKDKDVMVTLVANPPNANPDQRPQRLELWLNDYRVGQWSADDGKPFEKMVTIKKEEFLPGENTLALLVFSRSPGGESRAERTVKVTGTRPPAPPNLYGLFVGVGDYSQAKFKDGKSPRDLVFTAPDATSLFDRWQEQIGPGRLFAAGKLSVLVDGKQGKGPITRKAILDELDAFAKVSRPEDLVVLFLAGHGDLHKAGGDVDSFVFLPSDYLEANVGNTGVSSRDLIDKLGAIKGRKVVLLDSCKSGGMVNPVRELAPGGRGPNILASCGRAQYSFDHEKTRHGVFTAAVLEALDGDDVVKPGERITAEQLGRWLETRVPKLAKEVDPAAKQVPMAFPSKFTELVLAQRLKENK